jgi:hypothetical protein
MDREGSGRVLYLVEITEQINIEPVSRQRFEPKTFGINLAALSVSANVLDGLVVPFQKMSI